MATILFFILAGVLGVLLVYLIRIEIFLEEKIIWGLVLGSVSLTIIIFLFSLFFGFSRPVIFLSFLAAAFILAVISLRFYRRIFQEISEDVKVFKNRLKTGKLTLFFCLFLISLIFFATLWPKVLFKKGDNLFTIGTAGVWGDWAAHTSYISHFLYSDKISFSHPLFLGEKFSYTFMADFLSAVLMKMGENLIPAMVLPGIFFSLFLLVILYYFLFRLTKKETASFLAVILYFLGGGFGFFYFYKNIKSLSFLQIINYLKTSPLEYTCLADNNIHWTSFINALLLPQRSLTMGLPLGILILSCILIALEEKNNKLLLFAGIFSAFLPTIHLHSLVAISLAAIFLIVFLSGKNIKLITKRLVTFYLPFLLLSFWQIFILFPVEKDNFKFHFGWMTKNEGWLLFWIKNLGLFFLLLLPAFLLLKKRLKIIYLCFVPLFFLANLFLFQPHDYDNIKIMTYWFLLTAGIIALFLVKMWQKNIFGKIFAVIIFPFLIFSSSLDLLHLYVYPGYLFLSKEDIEIAEIIKKETPQTAIFLTSDKHNHFIPTLTGRQILMGYRGWLWTYGFNYSSREKDVLTMFQGGKEAENLLKRYKVDYVVVGPSEKSNFSANEPFYEENFPLIFQLKDTRIYKIISQ